MVFKIIYKFSPLILLISSLIPETTFATCLKITKIGAFEKDGYEWIEIRNCGEKEINFKKWRFLENIKLGENNQPIEFKAHLIKSYNSEQDPILNPKEISILATKPENYLSIYSDYKGKIFDSSFNLSKKGEIIGFKDEEGNFISIVNYPYCKESFVELKNEEYVCHEKETQKEPLSSKPSTPQESTNKIPKSLNLPKSHESKKQKEFSLKDFEKKISELNDSISTLNKNLQEYLKLKDKSSEFNILLSQILILSNQILLLSNQAVLMNEKVKESIKDFDNKISQLEEEIKKLKTNKISYFTKRRTITNAKLTKKRSYSKLKKAEGVVIAPPGLFSKNYFYINGTQIYSYKGDFPKLEIGDFINVLGEESKIYDEDRIKVPGSNNIKVIKKGEKINPIEISDFSKEILSKNLSKLIKTQGVIEEVKETYFKIRNLKGDMLKVYYKDRIKNIDLIKGKNIVVLGVLSKYKNEFRILPRGDFDLVIKNINTPEIKGEMINKKFFSKTNLFTGIIYLVIILIIILYFKLGIIKI